MVAIEQLAGYRVTTDPGRVGLYAVARATRESDHAEVTVHVVVEPLDRATLRRVRTELSSMATALEELNNPLVVPLLDHGQTPDGRPFFVTGPTGPSLADELAERGPLSLDQVRLAVFGTATALVSLHDANLLHRGLGPAALLRQPSGRVLLSTPVPAVLAEIAGAVTEGSGHEPIEVLKGGDWTPRAEVYAFASTVWTLATGRPPVPGSRDERLLHLFDESSAPPSAPGLPPRMADLLRRALARRPDDRPRSLASFALDLKEELADPGRTTRLSPGGLTPSEQAMGTDYTLLSELGSGSAGTVWRARRRSDGREVAVKVLNPEADPEGAGLARLAREHATLRGLDHPHLVKVLDIVVDRGRSAIVMELVPGTELRGLLKSGLLAPADGVRLLSEVASGLAHLHERRIVHRDVKPANILVRTTGDRRTALLTDFGLAKPLGEPDLTRVGLLLGTPSYLAPELITSGEPSPEADVYALGVTAYEVLAGRRPFSGSTTDQVLRQHQVQRPERPVGLSDAAWSFLSACLEKDPSARPSAVEASEILHDLIRDLALTPSEPASPPDRAGTADQSLPTRTGARPVEPAPGHAVVDNGEQSLPTRTSGRRPEPAPAPPVSRPARRHLVVAAAVVAIAGAGFAIGTLVIPGIVDPDRSASTGSPPTSTTVPGIYRVPATVVVDADGAATVSWPADTTALPELDRFVVMQGNSPRQEVPADTTTYRDPEPRETGCYYVIALGTTARPLDPVPQPACPTR
ncbi:hypothetical protein ALI22I_14540 [Saccharothrix sp. ALI-22-I]|uniref:protein kinase domain-containing protein n=1 Tax=Saccharothrix sp. ALI-22-I TaxID=1933778 RepID=UPI00097C3D9E|nr:serine/threonine-protein kinase [Saccharothrix sp. ALI-22-I]ONI89713.1 hypothetical protein ALI22I_14540 [Saccharothrix sp. ALI-22-I]